MTVFVVIAVLPMMVAVGVWTAPLHGLSAPTAQVVSYQSQQNPEIKSELDIKA